MFLIKYLDRDLIDFVQDVDTGHVDAVPLDRVDQVFVSGVHSQRDVGIVNLVLGQDGFDHVRIQVGLSHLCSRKHESQHVYSLSWEHKGPDTVHQNFGITMYSEHDIHSTSTQATTDH